MVEVKREELQEFVNDFSAMRGNPQQLDAVIGKNNDDENAAKKVDIMQILHDQSFKKDISADQDLAIALMNLIGIEEHLFFTGAKTGKHAYYDLILEVREIRKKLLGKIIKQYEGEVWCISKHLLAASYRLMEVGTKQLGQGRATEAYELFDEAYELFCLFWGVNLPVLGQLVGDEQVAEAIATAEQHTAATTAEMLQQGNMAIGEKLREMSAVVPAPVQGRKGMGKLKGLLTKLINCCIE